MAGKKSAPAIRCRLDRLGRLLGDRKIRDVARQNVVGVLDRIAQGQAKGHTAEQVADPRSPINCGFAGPIQLKLNAKARDASVAQPTDQIGLTHMATPISPNPSGIQDCPII